LKFIETSSIRNTATRTKDKAEGDQNREESTEFSLNSRRNCKQATHFALALPKNASGGGKSSQSKRSEMPHLCRSIWRDITCKIGDTQTEFEEVDP
jgi:hypothetical protein